MSALTDREAALYSARDAALTTLLDAHQRVADLEYALGVARRVEAEAEIAARRACQRVRAEQEQGRARLHDRETVRP